MAVQAVETAATIAKVATRANGFVAVTFNLGEAFTPHAAALMDWLLYDVQVAVSGTLGEPLAFDGQLYAVKTTMDFSIDVTVLTDDVETTKRLLGMMRAELGVLFSLPATSQ